MVWSTAIFAQPAIQISSTTIEFGPVTAPICSERPQPCGVQDVAIANTGNTTLNFTGLTITGATNDFFLNFGFPFVSPSIIDLNPGETARIPLKFQPSATGLRTATLVFQDNATNSPQQVTLQGTGVGQGDWGFAATTGNNKATITAGEAATFDTTLLAAPGFSGSFTFACSGLPAGSKCSAGFDPSSQTLGPQLGSMAGPAIADVFFEVSTTPQSSSSAMLPGHLLMLWALIAIGSLLSFIMRAKPAKSMIRAFAGLLLLGTLISCGGSSATPPTPAGTYQLTFTVSSGSTSRSTNVSMIVQ
jgi:hypothetical protein